MEAHCCVRTLLISCKLILMSMYARTSMTTDCRAFGPDTHTHTYVGLCQLSTKLPLPAPPHPTPIPPTTCTARWYLGVLDGVAHDVLPVLVHLLEQLALLWHLLQDVLGGEDGLEVEPLRLHLEPLVQRVLQQEEACLPLLHGRGGVSHRGREGLRQFCTTGAVCVCVSLTWVDPVYKQ